MKEKATVKNIKILSVLELMKEPAIRWQLYMIIILTASVQLCGINAVECISPLKSQNIYSSLKEDIIALKISSHFSQVSQATMWYLPTLPHSSSCLQSLARLSIWHLLAQLLVTAGVTILCIYLFISHFWQLLWGPRICSYNKPTLSWQNLQHNLMLLLPWVSILRRTRGMAICSLYL